MLYDQPLAVVVQALGALSIDFQPEVESALPEQYQSPDKNYWARKKDGGPTVIVPSQSDETGACWVPCDSQRTLCRHLPLAEKALAAAIEAARNAQ